MWKSPLEEQFLYKAKRRMKVYKGDPVMDKKIYITINHLDDFESQMFLMPGDVLTLKKDKKNTYDDEAIAVFTKDNYKCGYVANSVHSVARGTYSAGRVYDQIKDEARCCVRFILPEEGCLIAEIV